jgi:hypothetical protein
MALASIFKIAATISPARRMAAISFVDLMIIATYSAWPSYPRNL